MVGLYQLLWLSAVELYSYLYSTLQFFNFGLSIMMTPF